MPSLYFCNFNCTLLWLLMFENILNHSENKNKTKKLLDVANFLWKGVTTLSKSGLRRKKSKDKRNKETVPEKELEQTGNNYAYLTVTIARVTGYCIIYTVWYKNTVQCSDFKLWKRVLLCSAVVGNKVGEWFFGMTWPAPHDPVTEVHTLYCLPLCTLYFLQDGAVYSLV